MNAIHFARFQAIGVLLLGILFCPYATAERIENPFAGRSWAILIGPEQYHHASNLRYTGSDVEELAKTLERHAGYSPERILKMVDTAPNERFQPLQKSIMQELPRWLAKPGPKDFVLVYFSGHGFRDENGRLYIAPVDCDPKNLIATGIPVQWLRNQLDQCRADVKLLVLDSCHAGSEKGPGAENAVSSKDLGSVFEDSKKTVTLASSQGNEKSLIWDAMRQSLFSYWLNLGLKGHADVDADGRVTIDELYEFVHKNVLDTSDRVFHQPQTPVRIVRSQVLGVPVVASLWPSTLNATLEDLAEQISSVMRVKNLTRVGIAPFTASTTDPEATKILKNGPGLLGRYCAEQLGRRLTRNLTKTFEVAPHGGVYKSLSAEGLSPADLETSAVRGMTVEGKKLPVIAVCRFSARTGRILSVQCGLRGTEDGKVYGTACGTCELNPSEWAMLGRSANTVEDDRPAPRPGMESAVETPIQRLDREANGPHPMNDSSFPFHVKIMVDGRERKPIRKGNDLFVPLRRGELYAIRIKSDLPTPVFMRLLVDGLNTLPDKVPQKGVSVEGKDEYLPAQRVSLADARHWEIDPNDASEVEVDGFLVKEEEITDARGNTKRLDRFRKFEVTDAPTSLAAERGFTDQIGMITAAFYSVSRGYTPCAYRTGESEGTKLGPEYIAHLEESDPELVPGRLLGVVHIRYASPEAIRRDQHE